MKYTVENIGTIKAGKCQFNVKTAKSMRDTMAKWSNAQFELTDAIKQKQDRVNNLNSCIATNMNLVEKLDAGEMILGHKTKEELLIEVNDFIARIDKENSDLNEFRDVQKKRFEDAEKLMDKELYNAYVEYILDPINKKNGYTASWANWLANNGIEPCMDTITKFMATVGERRNSLSNQVKLGKHNGVNTFVTWQKLVLGSICDIMIDEKIIDKYKFAYVPKSERAAK